MGLYATTTSLYTMLVGTREDTATTALLQKTITHAQNEVNKWISKRYDVGAFNDTSTSVPPLITSLTETLAEGYYYQRNSRGSKEGMAQAKALIDQAVANLKLISEYKLDLVDSSGDVIADMSNTAYRIQSSTSGYKDTFDEGEPLDWEVSEQKIDDIEDETD
jgi:hypothetical protein